MFQELKVFSFIPLASKRVIGFSFSSFAILSIAFIIDVQFSFKDLQASFRADHLVSERLFIVVNEFKISHRCVDKEKKLYILWSKLKNRTTSEQQLTAFTPTKFNEWAAQGTNLAKG